MVVRRRRKAIKYRGSRTHGYGLVHRGSGNRGGVGNAGTGKKAQCKKPQVWKTRYLGKDGFVKHGQREFINAVTIKHVEQSLEKWCAANIASKQQDSFVIDLGKIGFTKLLSTGRVTKKLNITVKHASPEAVGKIKSAGGSVVTQAK